ncbi:ABC transporter permease [Paracoccaceae bacterium]|nr:ABC transporter permease [Paracoccaceae bacterium]
MNHSVLVEYARRFTESPLAVISLFITLVMVLCAVLGPVIAPTNPYDLTKLHLSDALQPVGSVQKLPGEEIRVRVTAGGGNVLAEPTGTDRTLQGVSVTRCGDGCLDVAVLPRELELERLQIRDLPAGAVVEGAKKHVVQPWWTISAPQSGTVRITSSDDLPDNLKFLAIVQAAAHPSGLVFWLGTDGLGRDMLSAILYGIRISVMVGLVAATAAMLIGTGLGLIAAWFGGVIDALIMRTVDFMLGFPALLVGLVVLAILGNGVDKVILAIVAVQWSYYARTTRSIAMSELGKEYVEAARTLRLGAMRIMLRHVLPNCLPQVIVLLTLNIAAAISLESALSFLGIGLPLTEPSLGMLIANGYEYLFSQKYWVSMYPGIVLLVMIVALNLLGDRMRDMNNPRLSG